METKLPLKSRLLSYLQKRPTEWVAKGALADLARASELRATGEATGRRLRELHEAEELEVKYERGHAFYRITPLQVHEWPSEEAWEKVYQSL